MSKYNRDDCLQYVESRIGVDAVKLSWPRIDRLITLWQQYEALSQWLEDNRNLSGSKEYKENVTALNGLMQNIRNLETDLDLYREETQEEVGGNDFASEFDL